MPESGHGCSSLLLVTANTATAGASLRDSSCREGVMQKGAGQCRCHMYLLQATITRASGNEKPELL